MVGVISMFIVLFCPVVQAGKWVYYAIDQFLSFRLAVFTRLGDTVLLAHNVVRMCNAPLMESMQTLLKQCIVRWWILANSVLLEIG